MASDHAKENMSSAILKLKKFLSSMRDYRSDLLAIYKYTNGEQQSDKEKVKSRGILDKYSTAFGKYYQSTKIAEVDPTKFSCEEYCMIFTTIYSICMTVTPPYRYYGEFYFANRKANEDYFNSTVLPSIMESIRENDHESMLEKLVNGLKSHKMMIQLVTIFFCDLDRHFMLEYRLPGLYSDGISCFFEQVYGNVKLEALNAIIALIGQERDGMQVERALLKDAVNVFVENSIECYQKDFECPMINGITDYYANKASLWIDDFSCPEYMIKVEECLENEKDRVSHYLHSSTVQKLVERVTDELMVLKINQLLTKQPSCFRDLIRDDKVEDLSRMYGLVYKRPRGLWPVACAFKELVTKAYTDLLQQAKEAIEKKDLSVNILKIHDKFLRFVVQCFDSDPLFRRAVWNPLHDICSNHYCGDSIGKLLLSYCRAVMKQGGKDLCMFMERREEYKKRSTLERVVDDFCVSEECLKQCRIISGNISIEYEQCRKMDDEFCITYINDDDDININNTRCLHCTKEAHHPVDCETAMKWMSMPDTESFMEKWMLAFTKPCPKCKSPIQLTEGCNHVTCGDPCYFEFCWLCLTDWGKNHVCDSYRMRETVMERDEAKQYMQRYMHYLERWDINLSLEKKALADLHKMEDEIIEKLSHTYVLPVPGLKFITKAWEQVVECRRILKWTYVWGYFLPEEELTRKELFEYWQVEAESGLEFLHKCAEKDLQLYIEAIEPLKDFMIFQTRLTKLTAITRSCFRSLVKELESGLPYC